MGRFAVTSACSKFFRLFFVTHEEFCGMSKPCFW